ncbi:MAG: glycosyltransferase family 4 protein [Coriobacteriia bacterium]|nr:glycosyltransferase family 4 protein [Coriobacteriia bacterium]
MRVLMVVRPASGGMKEHVLALVRGLVARGHEVELAAPASSGITDAARAAGITVRDVPIAGPLHPIQDPRAVRALSRLVSSGGFDVVHAHGFKAGFIGRLAVRASGTKVPFIVTAHNHVLTRTDTPAATRWRYRTVERSLERYVSRYIAVSESIGHELTDAYDLPAEKVVVVRNGVDVTPFLEPQDPDAARVALGVPVDSLVVGLAARFSAQKGLRDLVAATPELVRRLPGVRIVIGGSGPLESELRGQAVALGVADSIVWPGHVLDMPRFLAALDVFVSPATTEAFGIALIEAAAAGVPTIATRVGGVPEVILDGETGLLVAPHDPTALAQAIVGLLDDRGTAIKLAEHARRRAIVEFSPELMVDGTVEVYAAAIAERA